MLQPYPLSIIHTWFIYIVDSPWQIINPIPVSCLQVLSLKGESAQGIITHFYINLGNAQLRTYMQVGTHMCEHTLLQNKIQSKLFMKVQVICVMFRQS